MNTIWSVVAPVMTIAGIYAVISHIITRMRGPRAVQTSIKEPETGPVRVYEPFDLRYPEPPAPPPTMLPDVRSTERSLALVDPDPSVDEVAAPAWFKATRGFSEELMLRKSVITVGRDSGQDIVIRDSQVSREHLILSSREGHWYVQDLGGPNGTFVNNGRIPPGPVTRLHSGDTVRAGGEASFVLITRDGAQSDLVFSTGSATARGGRAHNEDSCRASSRVLAVADGVGGRPHGEIASRIAVDLAAAETEILGWTQVLPAIEAAVLAYGRENPEAEDMATTLDAARLGRVNGVLCVNGIHIGDGIALHDDGAQLQELTSPHNAGMEIGRGRPIPGSSGSDAGRLTRAIGFPGAEANYWTTVARPGERYVLTSDGLVRALGNDHFTRLLRELRSESPRRCAKSLIAAAASTERIPASSLDNLTIVVADVSTDPHNEGPRS